MHKFEYTMKSKSKYILTAQKFSSQEKSAFATSVSEY